MKHALDGVLTAGIERGAAPGVVGVVVDRDGTLYEGAFGERAVGTGDHMTPDTIGAIFSMTKALTGSAAMMLVERGEMDLDAPASDVCDELADPVVLTGFDPDGRPVTRPAEGPVTLRQLLTHTSGYAYSIWNSDLGRWYEATETPDVFSLRKVALQVPLAFDPGTKWEYGIGIDWAGQMVERVSGQTLGEFFNEHLTGPLGMADTSFVPAESMASRRSAVHTRLPDGAFAAIDLPAPEQPEFEMGGGGLHGTMGDYARFIRLILNDGLLDGTRLLAPETVEQMAANHIGDLRVTELRTANPAYSNDAEMFAGEPKSWGLTFQIHEVDGRTGRPAGTLSWAGLANSYFWIDRTNGIGGCYLTQILPFADEASLRLYEEFERTVYTSR